MRKRGRIVKPAFVTGYDIDVDAVASAMLRDETTSRLIRGWVRTGGSSRAARPEFPPA